MEIINYDNKTNEIKMEDIIYHGPDLSGFSNYLVVDWGLLHGCNYKCSYCFGQEGLNKKDFIPLSLLKSAVDKLFNLDKEFYVFSLLGGEPTYHPNFLELIEYIFANKNKKIFVKIASNCSRNIEYFNKLLSYVKDNSFIMNFSVHFEYADIEHIKNLIVLFNQYEANICINFMLHPDYKDKIKTYFNELISFKKEYHFDFILTELREPPDFSILDSRYDDEFFEWIRKSRDIIENTKTQNKTFNNIKDIRPNTFFTINKDVKENVLISEGIALKNNLKSFVNFYCCGGARLINIKSDGSYYGATCSNFPRVGNIYYDKEIDLYKLTNFVKCSIRQCGCGINNSASKFRNIDEAKKYVLNYRKKYPELMMEYILNTTEALQNKVNNIDNKVNNIDNNKINKLINTLAWWIPFKKKRDEFRKKFDI